MSNDPVNRKGVVFGDYLAVVGSDRYHNKNYTVCRTGEMFDHYLESRGLPGTIVIGDDFSDTTPTKIVDAIIAYSEKYGTSLKNLRVMYECYEKELRTQLRDRIDAFRADHT
jgi:hypothetical protein